MFPAAVTLMVTGCLLAATAAVPDDAAQVTFERHEIELGSTTHQTVVPGFFLGGAMADLAVLSVAKNGDRRLQIFELSAGAWSPKLDASLGSEVSFADVMEIAGRDRLITFERGRLKWFDPESMTKIELADVGVTYKPTHDLEGSPAKPGRRIPQVDITRDLNHDGRDDLVVPDVDGFWIVTQSSDGSFADAVKLGPPEPFADESMGKLDAKEARSDVEHRYRDKGITAATIPIYLGRVHEMDYDQDGRSDLVFWNRDHFDVYTQDERGQFGSAVKTFTVNVPFDFDGAYSRLFDYTDKGLFSLLLGLNKKTKRTVLHSFHDLNGDRVADLVTLTLTGRTMFRQRSLYEVHFGAVAGDVADAPDGHIVFARRAGAMIRARMKAGGLQPWGYASERFEDFDGDGRLEIMFRSIRVGLGGMSRALIGNSVAIDLEFYRLEGGVYSDKPTAMRKLRRFAPFAGVGNVFLPPVLMGDVNGDGRADLLVGENPKELQVFLGVPEPGLLARKAQEVKISLPSDERNTWLVDLDKDGKQDLVVHHTPTERKPTDPNRVTLLISR